MHPLLRALSSIEFKWRYPNYTEIVNSQHNYTTTMGQTEVGNCEANGIIIVQYCSILFINEMMHIIPNPSKSRIFSEFPKRD